MGRSPGEALANLAVSLQALAPALLELKDDLAAQFLLLGAKIEDVGKKVDSSLATSVPKHRIHAELDTKILEDVVPMERGNDSVSTDDTDDAETDQSKGASEETARQDGTVKPDPASSEDTIPDQVDLGFMPDPAEDPT